MDWLLCPARKDCLLVSSRLSEAEADTPPLGLGGMGCIEVLDTVLSRILLVEDCNIDGRLVSLCLSSEKCFDVCSLVLLLLLINDSLLAMGSL